MRRRGFLGVIAGAMAAPLLPKPAPVKPVETIGYFADRFFANRATRIEVTSFGEQPSTIAFTEKAMSKRKPKKPRRY